LFGWHPVHVESVAWVAERKDVLSLCFGLLALLMYARYAGQTQVRGPKTQVFYGLTLLFFGLGLMSKAMLVTWPFVMLLLDGWPLGRFKTVKVRRLVAEKLPFFALAAVMSVVTYEVQKAGGAVQVVETLPLGARMGNALISYCRYLGKLFWPVELAGGGGAAGWGIALGRNGGVAGGAAALSVPADGVAVVCGDAGAGDWVGAGGGSGAGGPVHLYSVGWGVGSGHLGSEGTDPPVAVSEEGVMGGGVHGRHSVLGNDAATTWVLAER